MDHTHLIALQNRLASEKERFSKDGQPIRKVWISQIEKEIQGEKEFLGLQDVENTMSDEDLLAALFA